MIIRNGDVPPSYVNVYQRVIDPDGSDGFVLPSMIETEGFDNGGCFPRCRSVPPTMIQSTSMDGGICECVKMVD